jgi:hypothetical protein
MLLWGWREMMIWKVRSAAFEHGNRDTHRVLKAEIWWRQPDCAWSRLARKQTVQLTVVHAYAFFAVKCAAGAVASCPCAAALVAGERGLLPPAQHSCSVQDRVAGHPVVQAALSTCQLHRWQ